ncbi:hypothetical protein Ppa06_42360 [Planomonospora parontospora subsp. parontospora]|uniref:DUF2252 domain-containing protein n=2 Tax=Planomonospora parontospora TaxID=58119 RepID=A0AA37F6D5_9ACTN|nr:DUF2252 domain-containing protein [Planomonospora parontospora]GGK83240.1 hypothetical protein GCM10010126_48220 [Planomonospora parontospora]GII10438.1 hypothetical protein Ppa06_42360 [Planomonospora parontospora subsp. parontospora]
MENEKTVLAERAVVGRAARKVVPRREHAGWTPPRNRPDPVARLSAQEARRLPWLLPVRHARMAESPLAFFRGSAELMAADLACTPVTGFTVQLCGDAHLANFGTFASPERRQVFDVNDFDETLPGPWEWDVKRLAASFVLAARDNGYGDAEGREAAVRSVNAYQRAMAGFAAAGVLDVWYAQVSLQMIKDRIPRGKDRRRFASAQEGARRQTSQRVLTRLTERAGGRLRIRSEPPLLVPLREMGEHDERAAFRHQVEESFADYLSSLSCDRRHLLSRFRMVDVALKVVGVGSVGTRCFIVLMQGREHDEPLFLQVKEAGASVLEAHLPGSEFSCGGQRIVEGQRLMQASGDIFLGWSRAAPPRDHYWRQFRDMKGAADIPAMDPRRLRRYAGLCGWTLAHGHARSGDATAIAAYLGAGDAFAEALGDFAVAYADQVRRDHAAFVETLRSQRNTETSGET